MGSVIGDANTLSDLVVVRRLMIRMERAEQQRKAGHSLSAKEAASARTELEEDQALLSGQGAQGAQAAQAVGPAPKTEDVQINLGELFQRLKALNEPGGAAPAAQAQTVELNATRIQTEIEVHFEMNLPVEGLVVRDQGRAESSRYRFDFQDGMTLKITDKTSGKSTTIWGDPHVDTSDQEGNQNGEFSDLTTSQTQTTLMLKDNTRLTFTAQDRGVIEAVDIFQGSQHIHALGQASASWSDAAGRFAQPVQKDGSSAAASLDPGDVVYAGEDGTDWYSRTGALVWGKVTPSGPPLPTASASLSVSYHQTIQQVSIIHTLDVQG